MGKYQHEFNLDVQFKTRLFRNTALLIKPFLECDLIEKHQTITFQRIGRIKDTKNKKIIKMKKIIPFYLKDIINFIRIM